MYIIVKKPDVIKVADKGIAINNKELDSTLNKYKIEHLKQSFPYSKNEYLRSVYKIKFKGNAEELKSELKKKHGSIIGKVMRLPKTENIAVYDPGDYMWVEHKDDWLWHLPKIEADKAWDITHGDVNVKIGILDTWFDINHPDLDNELLYDYDPYDNTSFSTNCNQTNHGTTVASFAAGENDGGGQLASIGFDCKIIPYQAWDGDYLERAHHASLSMNVDVVTSSAGGWDCRNDSDLRDMERIAVQEILDNGTIIVMPAGNGNNGEHCRPSGYSYDRPFFPLSPLYDERIIIVSSTDKNDNHTYVKSDSTIVVHSYFPEVDICAPGYCVMGAKCTEKKESGNCVENSWPYYGCSIGTSFATPIVAGTCALIKSVKNDITPAQAQEIIKKTSDPITDADQYQGMLGTGRLNAYCAVYQSQPLNLSGALSGNYERYFININNATINTTTTINSAEVNIEGPFEVNAEFIIDNPENYNCP